MHTTRTLFNALIDYAGLFPPSELSMERAVENYASYRASEQSWMLSRFVLPLTKLEAFEDAAQSLLPVERGDEPWQLSAILSPHDIREQIDLIFAFNSHHEEIEGAGLVQIDSVEVRVPGANAEGARFIDETMQLIPEQIDAYFELPLGYDLRGVATAIAGTGGRAKVRCGGVTPDLIPSTASLADFIMTCHDADIAFKATAGLHHPVRAEQNLTYADSPPRATMHGFLNVFLAAAFVRRAKANKEVAQSILNETDPTNFRFTTGEVAYEDLTLSVGQLASAREAFAMSFGSCSFDEPVEDLRGLELLPVGENLGG